MEELIARELDRFDVPGAAVAVVKDGQIELAAGFGVRDIEKNDPVTERTLFPIGSTTKAITATVVGCLVDAGLLEWDRPVREYLSSFRLNDPAVTQEVNLRDMLCHRTGLPRHDMLMLMYGEGGLSRAELVDRLRHLELNKGLREAWQYNNLIFAAVGQVVETVSGLTWEQAVARYILEPAGMTNSNFELTVSRATEDHSEPHSVKDGRVVRIPFRSIEMLGPAGSINSCAEDMARWLLLNVDQGEVEGTRVISPGSLHQVHEPTMMLPGGASQFEEIDPVGYGLGWIVEHYRGHRLLWHNGGIDGFKALVSFVPKQRAGVCVMSNRFPTEGPEALGYHLIDVLLGLEPIAWGERFRKRETTFETAAQDAKQHTESKAKPAGPTHHLNDFAGTYEHPGYGSISFRVENEQLVADLHALEVTMKHRHYNVWDATETAHEIVIPFAFQIDLEGDISSVEASLEPTVAPIRFERTPDEALTDPKVLESLVGTYSLGPVNIEVAASGRRLKATLPGAGALELIPLRNFRFQAKGEAGVVLEFVVDESGAGKQIVIENAGVFERNDTRKAGS